MEMLIVVAIVVILLAIAIPAFIKSLEKSKEAACLANRRSLLSTANTEYLIGNYDSPEDAFKDIYKGTDEKKYVCPDGGTFSWETDSDGDGHIKCSFHDGGEEGGGGSGEEEGGGGESGSPSYPGTPIPLEGDDYWPTDSAFEYSWSSVSIAAGSIFKYSDGNYYIVSKNISVTKSQASSGPGGDVYGWYATQKITGRVVTYSSESEQKSDLHRGDMCKIGDSYYVFVNGGTYAFSPTSEPGSWYKIP